AAAPASPAAAGWGRRARASLRHSGRRRRRKRAKDTEPASEDIFGRCPGPRVVPRRPGVDPGPRVPARPRHRLRPLAA
ncbi:hypothetical protein P7K49_024600, partial [Saguinus oedipus]